MTDPKQNESPGSSPRRVETRTIEGKYALIREIGSGAAASVYEAEHMIVGKRVAIKLLHPIVARDESLVARFIGEARAVAQIGHENLVDIYDFGVTGDRSPYLVMELLAGETLEALLERRGALPPAYACELMAQILAGLAAAHSIGIVHCDLKPANVFITHPRPDKPLVKVLDFGIAKGVAAAALHNDVGLLGTPLYMSPEQAVAARDVDERADVYAAGVILYEMLAGEPPYGGDLGDVLQKVIQGRVRPLAKVNPAVPPKLAHAVTAAMKTNRDERIPSAHAFAYQLAPYLSHPPPFSIQDGPRSAHAFLLTAKDAGIRITSGEDALLSRPPRDFPSLHLAKVAGKPNGEPLSDDILQSPIIPRAPGAPHIQSFGSERDLERWSNAPARIPTSEGPQAQQGQSEPVETTRSKKARRFVSESPSRRRFSDEAPLSLAEASLRPSRPWRRAIFATAVGVGLGAALAWLSYLG
jgi:serine/threonine protein kinase